MAKLAFNLKFSESHFSKNLDVFVGLRGGADSIALLHYLNEMNKSSEIGSLQAIHVNHGYSTESKKWENFCKDFCRDHNIELTTTSNEKSLNFFDTILSILCLRFIIFKLYNKCG